MRRVEERRVGVAPRALLEAIGAQQPMQGLLGLALDGVTRIVAREQAQ
jgi:hypothetical protein